VVIAPRRADHAGRSGFAVAAVLLLLVGLTALAHGALVLAERERATSALEGRLLARRLLARSAARAPDSGDSLPALGPAPAPLAGGVQGRLRWTTEAVALDRELRLLVGVGRIDGLPGADRVAVIASALDPSARVAAAAAVVEAGGGFDAAGGTVTTTGWLSAPDPSATWICAPELAALDSLGAVAPVAFAPFVRPTDGSADGGVPGLGVLPGDTVLARIPARVAGSVTPGPELRAGICMEALVNWGSPTDPVGPCGGRMAVVASDGDVTIAGGEGQGVLVAAGSVTLTDGARFHGIVLAGADLVLERGAALVGGARVRGNVRVQGAALHGSGCAAARALRAAAVIRAPYLLLGSARVHPL
jgi:hypothetical protein